MRLSVKRKKKRKGKKLRGGQKLHKHLQSVSDYSPQHLSSSLCHSSGTKELARQTMILRREEKSREETRVRAQVVAKSSKAPGGLSELWF